MWSANLELNNTLREKQVALDALKQNITSLGKESASYDAERPHSKMSNRKKQEMVERIQIYRKKMEAEKSKNVQLTEKLAVVNEVS